MALSQEFSKLNDGRGIKNELLFLLGEIESLDVEKMTTD